MTKWIYRSSTKTKKLKLKIKKPKTKSKTNTTTKWKPTTLRKKKPVEFDATRFVDVGGQDRSENDR
ncbi:hypothetical protein CJ030_MR0G007457 [Morella rubra]|uniref:Uncharacterized protein n=1 Tax=Morella rubra TaxID=262757 RepID=A0A6A1UJG0_9ROSI|nr:hypothetical protein CJ030_MR0G007457 [Morella rubra]